MTVVIVMVVIIGKLVSHDSSHGGYGGDLCFGSRCDLDDFDYQMLLDHDYCTSVYYCGYMFTIWKLH